MKWTKKTTAITVGAAALVLIAVLLVGRRGWQAPPAADGVHAEAEHQAGDESPDRVELPPALVESLGIKTEPVAVRPLGREIRSTAVIEPNGRRIAHVGPRIAGRVVEVTAVLGQEVEEGSVLAELDSLELGRAKADYLKAKADVEVARAEYEREKRLWEQNISSEKDYLEARGRYVRAVTQLQASREALRLLGLGDEEIDALRWGGGDDHPPSHFPLLSPFAGTVIEKHIVLGELIRPDDKPFTIADLSTVWIQIAVHEKDLPYVRPGAKVKVRVEAYPDEVFEGEVTYVSDTVDEETRTARARVEIANRRRLLKPGMFATATLAVPEKAGGRGVVVPLTAVHTVRGRKVAFVKEGSSVFVARPLRIGRATERYVEVLEGLEPGREVVVEGGFHIKSILLKEELAEGDAH